MTKFSAPANVTQTRYGSKIAPATGRTRQNSVRVAMIATQSRTMSANAALGFCQPKNSGDHAALKNN